MICGSNFVLRIPLAAGLQFGTISVSFSCYLCLVLVHEILPIEFEGLSDTVDLFLERT